MGNTDPETYFRYIGANVRRLRRKHGLTQEQLADRVESHYTYIQRVEWGVAHPTVKMLVKLADALETTPGRLFWKAKAVTRKRGRPKGRKTR